MWDRANGMTWYLGGTPEIFYTIPKCEIFLFISELMNVLEVYNVWVLDTVSCWDSVLYYVCVYKNSITCVPVNIRKVYLQRKANKKHNNLRDKTDWWEFRSWRKMHIFLWRASTNVEVFFIPFFILVILYKWSEPERYA